MNSPGVKSRDFLKWLGNQRSKFPECARVQVTADQRRAAAAERTRPQIDLLQAPIHLGLQSHEGNASRVRHAMALKIPQNGLHAANSLLKHAQALLTFSQARQEVCVGSDPRPLARRLQCCSEERSAAVLDVVAGEAQPAGRARVEACS